MKLILLIGVLLVCAVTLPYKMQLALVNSVEVGKDQDPETWGCGICTDANRPKKAYIIEEKVKEIRAAVSVYEEYTVLAFRYTANLKNVWEDLLWAFQRQDEHAPKGCKVQKEYDVMWGRIRTETLEGLRTYVPLTKRLIITGISLGGGLAALSYVDIKFMENFDHVEVITFGAPRVGNRKWAKWFDSLTEELSARIYIKRDPIAFLPICFTPICNYKQIGNPIVCNKKKNICKSKKTCLSAEADDDEDDFDMMTDIATLTREIREHENELRQGKVEGIIDHIYGYPKIMEYDLCI